MQTREMVLWNNWFNLENDFMMFFYNSESYLERMSYPKRRHMRFSEKINYFFYRLDYSQDVWPKRIEY